MVSYMKRVLCLEYPPSCSSAPMPTSKTYVNEKENTIIVLLSLIMSFINSACVKSPLQFSAEITFALLL